MRQLLCRAPSKPRDMQPPSELWTLRVTMVVPRAEVPPCRDLLVRSRTPEIVVENRIVVPAKRVEEGKQRNISTRPLGRGCLRFGLWGRQIGRLRRLRCHVARILLGACKDVVFQRLFVFQLRLCRSLATLTNRRETALSDSRKRLSLTLKNGTLWLQYCRKSQFRRPCALKSFVAPP